MSVGIRFAVTLLITVSFAIAIGASVLGVLASNRILVSSEQHVTEGYNTGACQRRIDERRQELVVVCRVPL